MRVFAISDFHLSFGVRNKPMDVFGNNWTGHWEKISSFSKENIAEDDIILSSGDTSWGMTIDEALPDLSAVNELPGKKFIIRGNHDYWWSSYKKISSLGLDSIQFIQNNAFKIGQFVICGTRGWTVAEKDATDEDKKIFEREKIRLKLTLNQGRKLLSDGDKLILLMHYPPFNSRFENSDFTDIIAENAVDKVIYGHLHGGRSRFSPIVNKENTDYILTSCDFLDFTPLQIY